MQKEICTCAIGGHLIIMELKLTKEKGRGKMGVDSTSLQQQT
jgi:hypothetical protein